ncbi:MAG: hypothetical protein AAC990_04930 [Dehalococcoides mccartyi]|uniref:hypothetical protein n=1 Tax=Dehalococcoides mccartyi TaxID=61435 RepID=UPI0030F5C0DE
MLYRFYNEKSDLIDESNLDFVTSGDKIQLKDDKMHQVIRVGNPDCDFEKDNVFIPVIVT